MTVDRRRTGDWVTSLLMCPSCGDVLTVHRFHGEEGGATEVDGATTE